MAKQSQSKRIAAFLKARPKQRFNAREIAEALVEAHPEDYADKRNNPRFENEKAFITQIVAEIGSQKDFIAKASQHIFWQDKPRPRVYWYDSDKQIDTATETESDNDLEEDDNPASIATHVEQELRMLSSLHGIGVILLNTENPSESDIILPSKPRAEVDWQSVNRILVENADFKDYVELVSTYYQTGRVRLRDWNKI